MLGGSVGKKRARSHVVVDVACHTASQTSFETGRGRSSRSVAETASACVRSRVCVFLKIYQLHSYHNYDQNCLHSNVRTSSSSSPLFIITSSKCDIRPKTDRFPGVTPSIGTQLCATRKSRVFTWSPGPDYHMCACALICGA